MDQGFLTVINQIQQIKLDLYQKHKPQLIEGTREAMRKTTPEVTEKHASAYESLMRQQRKLVYKRDREAQTKELSTSTTESQQKDTELREQLASKINFRSAKEELNDQNQNAVLQKSWNKLTNSLKIRAVLKFIEAISPALSNDQVNQLRYLLISAINERKLAKISEIEYDSEQGQIITIHRLIQEGQTFKLVPDEAGDQAIGLKTFGIAPISAPALIAPLSSAPLPSNSNTNSALGSNPTPKIKIVLNKVTPKSN